MSQGARTRLILVSGFKQLALRERLMLAARKNFPDTGDEKKDHAQRSKWVEAKLFLGDAEPKVPVGTSQSITFARQLPPQLRKAKFK